MSAHRNVTEARALDDGACAASPFRAREERTLVYCDLEARSGVPFSVRLTARRLVWERPVSFKMRPTETTVFDLDDIADARLGRRSPWPLRIWGVLCAAVAITQLAFVPSGGPQVIRVGLMCIAGAMAVAAFRSANSRFELVFKAGGKVVRIRQPWSWSGYTRGRMAEALHRLAELLGDRKKLERELNEAENAAETPPSA